MPVRRRQSSAGSTGSTPMRIGQRGHAAATVTPVAHDHSHPRNQIIRGASSLGLPYTLSRWPLRRLALFAWFTRPCTAVQLLRTVIARGCSFHEVCALHSQQPRLPRRQKWKLRSVDGQTEAESEDMPCLLLDASPEWFSVRCWSPRMRRLTPSRSALAHFRPVIGARRAMPASSSVSPA
jgi:hypothetical protein